MLSKTLFIFIGGGLGSVFRFLINYIISIYYYSQFSTFLVNTIGSFLFGFFFIFFKDKSNLLNIFLLSGFLGGFTTFSQFSFDFIELNKNNLFISALYIIASITISIIGAGFGIFLAQKLK